MSLDRRHPDIEYGFPQLDYTPEVPKENRRKTPFEPSIFCLYAPFFFQGLGTYQRNGFIYDFNDFLPWPK